jgi:His-Xaa-Ser system protein HxsD
MDKQNGNGSLQETGVVRLVVVEIAIYSLKAILKSSYNFTGRAFIQLRYPDETKVEVEIRAKDPAGDVDRIVGDFLNDLIDQRLREIVGKETEPTRDLILAHALSQTNLLHPELETADASDDPLRIAQPDARARPMP